MRVFDKDINFVNNLLIIQLKPYVSYNVKDVTTEMFDARALFEQTLQKEIVKKHKQDEQAKSLTE